MNDIRKDKSRFFCILLLFFLFCLPVASQSAVCVFRYPDRDVYTLYPDATSFKTMRVILDGKKIAEAEKLLGSKLDSSDVGVHIFYLVYEDSKLIGFIHPHSEFGQYGTIEMLWALNLDGTIEDFLIQRSREKESDLFRSLQFRRRFHRFSFLDSNKIIASSRSVPEKLSMKNEKLNYSIWPIVFGAKKTLTFMKTLIPSDLWDSQSDH